MFHRFRGFHHSNCKRLRYSPFNYARDFDVDHGGVGAAKRFSGVKLTVVERIIWARILTLPATDLIGFILARAVASL
jgi:hypothetical protein